MVFKTSSKLLALISLTVLFDIFCIFNVDFRSRSASKYVWQDEFVTNLPIETSTGATSEEKADSNVKLSNEGDVQEAQHMVAGLSCEKFGGPSDEIASEMVYWSDIPADSQHVSPFKEVGPKAKYLTFEPDQGGWNNIRMSMETVVALAHAMGRTLVMPPEQGMYLLDKDKKGKQKTHFGFGDFFHFDSLGAEHAGLDIISTQEFLEREVLSGNIRSKSGNVLFPPGNRTDWNGVEHQGVVPLESWLRNFSLSPQWAFEECIAVFPKQSGAGEGAHLHDMAEDILNEGISFGERINGYINKPTPVDASTKDRMRELLAERTKLCIYDEKLQEAPVVHFMGDEETGIRLLVHFYAFLFFEDWKQDVWTKRFVRDHLRYVDEIQCAAARVVNAVREKARKNGSKTGTYTSFHIRRGDFQYEETRLDASKIFKNVKNVLRKGGTVYIATDERDKHFFDPLREKYKLYYLDDFMHLLEGVNTNYYGMLDQLIASRGRTFVGTYFSTFSGYINRIRGYHSQKDKIDGYKLGKLKSFYYAPKDYKYVMREYTPIEEEAWAREYPISWRDIDEGVDESAALEQ